MRGSAGHRVGRKGGGGGGGQGERCRHGTPPNDRARIALHPHPLIMALEKGCGAPGKHRYIDKAEAFLHAYKLSSLNPQASTDIY